MAERMGPMTAAGAPANRRGGLSTVERASPAPAPSRQRVQLRLDGRPDWSAVPLRRRARAILDWYAAHPDKFRERWGEDRRRGR